MHPYSVSSESRGKVQAWIAVSAVVVALLVYSPDGPIKLQAPWFLDAPSVMGLYALINAWFDRNLWKTPLARSLRLCNIPNIEGTWRGSLTPQNPDSPAVNQALPVTLRITQTWTMICVELEARESKSQSYVAAMDTRAEGAATLHYLYTNRPSSPVATMALHEGTVRLQLHSEGAMQELRGDYYSGRGRRSYGTLCVKRPAE